MKKCILLGLVFIWISSRAQVGVVFSDTLKITTTDTSQIGQLYNRIEQLTARLEAIEQAKPSEMEPSQKPFTTGINLGAARTDLKNAAVRVLLEITRNSDIFRERFTASTIPNRNIGFWFNSAPDVSIETGNADVFNAIIAKYEGDFAFFKYEKIDGRYEPSVNHVIHLLPFHVGMETNGQFSSFNALAEIGYSPLIQYTVSKKGRSDLLRFIQVAAYLQGGYKIKGLASSAVGGQKDESAEGPNTGLFRFKARAKVAPVLYQNKKSGFGLGIKGDGTFWYDFLNKQVYYKVDAALSVLIGNNKSIDLTYQKGSGAPNFNQGDQWSANLHLAF